jgi:serine/threonine protein phosphatase 1
MPAYRELPSIPKRLYTIGDIHGCQRETALLLDFLTSKEKLSQEDQIIFIGDYIDRGPDSKGVIELLLQFRKSFPKTIFLKGNHEDMLLAYLGFEGSMGEVYLLNGGGEMLTSYGVPEESKAADLFMAMPETHRDFFKDLDRYVVVDKYAFAHAGLDPLRSLHSQVDEDLFWIRDEFINNIHHFDKTILFGHTPFEDVVFHLPYKIGIDTGLVFGNKLTCVELVEQKLLQISRGAAEVKDSKFPG